MKITKPEGNLYNKYDNRSQIINLIMKGFFKNLDQLLGTIGYHSVYEAGCGEGYISQHIYNFHKDRALKITASDLSEKVINNSTKDFPHISFSVKTIYDLQELDGTFDLVVACEVLEHLDNPENALKELFRISKKYVFISVPNEPLWCIANFARCKYIRSLGNTPGHINHWSKKGITKLVENYGSIIEIKNPFPWTMLLCEKKI